MKSRFNFLINLTLFCLWLSATACSDSDDPVNPDPTIEDMIAAQDWLIVSLTAEQEAIQFVSQTSIETGIPDTIRGSFSYISNQDPCRSDDTFRFIDGGSYQMRTNDMKCTTNTGGTEGDVFDQGNWRVTPQDALSLTSLDWVEGRLFFSTEDSYVNFTFNPAVDPYVYEVVSGSFDTNQVTLEFTHLYEGQDELGRLPATVSSSSRMVLQKMQP